MNGEVLIVGRRSSGACGKLYAIIAVAYPSGSICTCSNGEKILKAPDTSGTWLCNVPNSGTWTVSATDGASTATKSVEITASGQSESVTLSYALYLFNNGVVDGISWDKVKKDQWNNGTVTINDTIELYAGSYPGDNYFVVSGIGTAIDLSEFSTLKAHLVKDEGEGTAKIYIGTSALDGNISSTDIPLNSANGIITVDISALEGDFFISLRADGYRSGQARYRRVGYDVIYLA